MNCIKCGSFAINENSYDRVRGVDSDLCDVHYWMKRATRITELEALCLNALYHHQGASSVVGQPIRKALGIGEYARLTEAQLKIIHNVSAPYAAIAEGTQA